MLSSLIVYHTLRSIDETLSISLYPLGFALLRYHRII
jgi:hypothetical protein